MYSLTHVVANNSPCGRSSRRNSVSQRSCASSERCETPNRGRSDRSRQAAGRTAAEAARPRFAPGIRPASEIDRQRPHVYALKVRPRHIAQEEPEHPPIPAEVEDPGVSRDASTPACADGPNHLVKSKCLEERSIPEFPMKCFWVCASGNEGKILLSVAWRLYAVVLTENHTSSSRWPKTR